MMLVGKLQATKVRILIPQRGAWIAECDLVLDASGVLPSGKVVLTIGSQTLNGTVDPRASGAFGPLGRIRVVAGAGGWDQIVTPVHEHSDGGVLSSLVIAKAAAAVGETAVVATPTLLGVDFARMAGPASQVLDGFDWYVDFTGVTQVAPRVPAMAPTDAQVLAWDPRQQRADVAITDSLIVPGTVFTDVRFGTITVVDVEQTFEASGARAIAWCSAQPISRLAAALTAFARAACGVNSLRQYVYRVISQAGDGRLTLQASSPADGVPDMVTISAWGSAGVSAKVTPGTLCLLEFGGDPGDPKVIAFDGTTPTEVDIAASALVDVDAPAVGIGTKATRSGVATLETLAPLFIELAVFVAGESAAWTALAAALKDINSGLVTPQPPGPPPGTIETAKDAATAIAAFATAVTEQLPEPTNFSTTVEAAS